MNNSVKKIYVYMNYFRTIPAFFLVNTCRFSDKCKEDIEAYSRHLFNNKSDFFCFSRMLVEEKSLRNVLLNRMHRNIGHYVLFRILFKPLESLYINTPPEVIDGGLSFQHGFSTIVAAKRIGRNCRIYQQCTIGFNGSQAPIIEDNVRICAGAKVIGGVILHSDCVVGAGAVVVKDIPNNMIAVGVPAKAIAAKAKNSDIEI